MARPPHVLAGSLAATLTATGILHLWRPRPFEALIPPALGSPRAWVYGSGVAELACAAAVAVPATRRVGGLATAALFVGVFPGNVKMALDSRPGVRSWARRPLVAWGRLPLQVPLVAWAWRVARDASVR
ncbi:membrane protein [Isoptericola halotolerans]|uniref:Membrane protein n=1 Tax=Isoptericola halotolerans TaxID=300560 RepID=A0ABX2A2H2_9MICO|nr:DoxX family protein [Isoptericola halotolerans]NOV96761.1 putative membrane protein [Isoptericola halotolerans]